jgi:anti-anti-sigma regulatory factor
LVLITISQLLTGSPAAALAINFVGIAAAILLLYLSRRGWPYVPYVLMLQSILLSVLVPPPPLFDVNTSLSLLIPPVTALILGGPLWIVLSAVATWLLALARSGVDSLPSLPPFYILYALIVVGMVLARMVMDRAMADMGQSGSRAADALDHAGRQAQALAAANQQLEDQLDQQRRLLDLVATLETPASPLADGVLFMPIVGHVDERRAQALTARILQQASSQRARLVILDIAGVPAIDTTVARGLLDTAQALRLLGCAVTLSGISAAVALTLVDLDIGLAGVTTVRSPQEALARYAHLNGQPADIAFNKL